MKEDGEIKRDERGKKGQKPGRVKIAETYVMWLRGREEDTGGNGGREKGRGPLLRALLLRRTVTNNYSNRSGD